MGVASHFNDPFDRWYTVSLEKTTVFSRLNLEHLVDITEWKEGMVREAMGRPVGDLWPMRWHQNEQEFFRKHVTKHEKKQIPGNFWSFFFDIGLAKIYQFISLVEEGFQPLRGLWPSPFLEKVVVTGSTHEWQKIPLKSLESATIAVDKSESQISRQRTAIIKCNTRGIRDSSRDRFGMVKTWSFKCFFLVTS